MTMRLIDVDEIHNLVRNLKKYMWSSPISTDRKVMVSTDDIQFGVDKIPSADAEPVRHGHWLGKPIAGYATVRCSNCKSAFLENKGIWKYCPNCGAKMDEVSE